MASLLTGTNPGRHGVRGIERALPGELSTLARMLHDAGYRTLGVQTNPWLHSRFGFVRFGTAEQV
jgi:arylsulfatase A-like enzyme